MNKAKKTEINIRLHTINRLATEIRGIIEEAPDKKPSPETFMVAKKRAKDHLQVFRTPKQEVSRVLVSLEEDNRRLKEWTSALETCCKNLEDLLHAVIANRDEFWDANTPEEC